MLSGTRARWLSKYNMKKLYIIGLTFILLFAVAMVGYGTYLNKAGENQITERMESRRVPLQGDVAKFRSIRPVLTLDTVNLYSDEMADAVALIDGRLESAYVAKNSAVRTGQILFTIVNEEISLKIQQAESSIIRAEAQLAQAKSNYARYTRLKDRNATSVEKFEEAQMTFQAAEASLLEARAVKQQLLVQEARQQVAAPLDGEILIMYRQPGSYVTAGTPLALIGNFRRLFFSLPIDNRTAQRLSAGRNFELNFHNARNLRKAYDTDYAAGNLGDKQVFPVYIREIMPALSEPAAMRKVLFEVDNTAGLLEQQAYGGVDLSETSPHRALTVPLAAMNDAARDTVFVFNGETLERRKVQAGADDGEFVEIFSGLREGDIVVTSASKGLEDGMKVTVNLTGGDTLAR